MFAGDLKNIFQMHGIDLIFELRKKNHKLNLKNWMLKKKTANSSQIDFFFLVVKCALFKFWTQADLIDKAKITTPLKMVMLFQQYLHSLNTLSK